ncbi:lipoprotein [Lacibacterium aquatile]|uniref:Lipoprotein n=1 Tax=Lacibacterium aquatile TaxID=1168082 RepID=A0ABW5DW84_9PROT
MIRQATVLLLVALALAACGKKGDLDAPDTKSRTFPRTYPSS